MTSSRPLRRPRKDAQLNRAHILEVARQAFRRDGVDVSMDALAKQAGVGPGTLYRHFRTKEDLLASLLASHHEGLERMRAAIEAEEGHAGIALERWIDALGDWMRGYEGLPEPLRAACRVDSALTATCQGVIETTDKFVRAAQDEGLARQSITGRDIFLGALAIAWAGGERAADENTGNTLRDLLKHGWGTTTAVAND
ncbi:TetR/AcrR family transcriptional regulator [Neorhizobium sp. S3-V5DH]|uniref:TetR/AcrR family transcriptional regulator n=1 Tax=Neorhizobium sp. S3-V5DH TaxID=2485166 RepID=UPI001046449E|nr:TetR/AcrR family transcriptional regulator [Neorhizobium sp. S3-V5DH]TCV67439.1 TetR family transcriptional regulator [Neorhizobium sp. S3-V5DH]